MVSIDRQQHALDVLKSINKAITNLRLYPDQSMQVINTVEKAYSELKNFLRLYEALRFGMHHGVPTLDGAIFERKGREQLDALALVDSLDKAGLLVMTLTQGIDRKKFKQFLSFFTANPEQIHKAGGSVAFVKQAGLASIFLEETENSIDQEQTLVQSFADFLRQIMVMGVQKDDIHLFIRQGLSGQQKEQIRSEFKQLDRSAHILVAVVCFVLQPVQQGKKYEASPDFSRLLENVSAVLEDEEFARVVGRVASLLTANLDKESLGLLFCQTYETRFGEALFSSLVAAIDKDIFRSVVELLRQEGEVLAESLEPTDAEQHLLVEKTCQRLMETVKGRQLHALEIMGMTEKQRQGKRLQAGLTALARGSLEGLRNKELLLHLSATLERLIGNKKENVAAAIIQALVGGLKLDNDELRLRSGEGLSLIAEKLVALNYWDWLEKLTPTFILWLKRVEDVDDSCHRFFVVLQEVLNHAYKTDNEAIVEKILPFFHAIRSGALGKSVEMKNLVGQIQEKAVDRNVLQSYLDRCLVQPMEERYCQKIIMHGSQGVQFLLDALLTNTRRPDRIRLLKVLTGIGGSLPSLLLGRLQDPMPWYGKRNLIRLLGETGDEQDASAVQGYLSHDDLRVQSEAFSCIYKLSGKKKKEYLLAALINISEKLKFQVVQALASVVDEEVVGVLIELLRDEKYFSADIKVTLLVSICETLGRSGSPQAQKALESFCGNGNARPKGMAKEVWQAAQRGLSFLDAERRSQKQRKAEGMKAARSAVRLAQSVRDNQSVREEYAPVTSLPEEQEVYVLLGQNKKVAAKELLLQLISTITYLRQFDQAEVLCQRLVEIDPLAMEDILQATQLVEEQKLASNNSGHGLRWMDVYDFFNTEEFNVFYSAMEHVIYPPDENFISQGDLQQRLIFINKGRVKLFHRDPRGNDILLKTEGPGDVFGIDSFFKDSVWTVNATSIGTVDAFILPREAVRKWQNTFPGLEEKLRDFCQQLVEQDSLKVVAVDRRGMERLTFSGMMAMAILDDQGKAIGTVLHGEKGDISIGGIATTVRVSPKRNIRLLLGRKVLITLPTFPAGNQLTSGKVGVVVAIYLEDSTSGGDSAVYAQYAIHVQFEQPLQESDLASVVSSG